MIRIVSVVVLSIYSLLGWCQPGYTISISEKKIPGFPALQSFVFGTFGDEVLLLGGRTDGLHKKQPWRSFHPDGRNDSLFVWDNVSDHIYAVSLDGLNSSLHEQLSASNHQFYQSGDLLCVVGGYGYSEKTDDKLTFAAAIFFRVSEVITAVKKGAINDGLFTRVEDERFALCGGQLEKLDDIWYLVGGHRFDGSYNPMGNPTYEQHYLNGFHTFLWDGQNVVWKESYFNEELLHRRDFNLVPSRDSLGKSYLTLMSGVFQPEIDMPYRSAVRMGRDTVYEVPRFYQFLNNYHSAHASIYLEGSTSHFFFGGISEYYLQNGMLIQDSNAPFVNTVSAVEETKGGLLEWSLPYAMPGYLGAGAAFVANSYVEHLGAGLLDAGSLCVRDSVLIGYVVGGITSALPNTFWPDEPTFAYANVIEVYLKKQPGEYAPLMYASRGFRPEVYTNAEMDEVHLNLDIESPTSIAFFLTKTPFEYIRSEQGSIGLSRPEEWNIEGEGEDQHLDPGQHHFVMSFEEQIKGEHYFYLIVNSELVFESKMIVE